MKKLTAILLMALCAFTAFAGGASEDDGVYVFAADATWPPFEFVDENGNLTGFEVELMPLIGEHVGVEMVVENIAWDTIFAGLANGQYDGVASGVTVTEERKQTMDFSMPIASQGQVVVVVEIEELFLTIGEQIPIKIIEHRHAVRLIFHGEHLLDRGL